MSWRHISTVEAAGEAMLISAGMASWMREGGSRKLVTEVPATNVDIGEAAHLDHNTQEAIAAAGVLKV